jgi:hypothetical protein
MIQAQQVSRKENSGTQQNEEQTNSRDSHIFNLFAG